MSTSVAHDAPAAQLSRPDSQDCSVCGKPLGEHWFCRIHRDDKVITMCSSACFASPPPHSAWAERRPDRARRRLRTEPICARGTGKPLIYESVANPRQSHRAATTQKPMKKQHDKRRLRPAEQPAFAPMPATPTNDLVAEEQIRERAHQIFLARGGGPGNELDDWLRAEQEIKCERATATHLR